ncbi:hypothetical protein HYW17_00785 [Candidatus Uhrbacteria bacterium]|nr:hypothetical protein [Candidatus Uhrbacteria bacterium]
MTSFIKRWFWYQNPVLRYLTIATAVLIFGQLLILALGIAPQEDPIFLHYTTAFGVDFIGAWYLVYLIPLASSIILGVNGLLARILVRRDPYLGQLMLAGALIAALLLLLQAILLLYVNS